MNAFCAGYFSGDLLFEVRGLQGLPFPVPGYVANTFGVLTRGAPTCPSPLLKKLLDPSKEENFPDWGEVFRTPLFLVGDVEPVWEHTIRGAPDGYNPALEFFDTILPICLPDWAFIRKLLIPEYPLFRKLGAPGSLVSALNEEQVDFFLPQADLVIEIDGGTHRETRQAWKDQNRDRFLERFGILTIRLNTCDLRAQNSAFRAFLERLHQRCEGSARLGLYHSFLADRRYAAPSIRYDLTAIIRLQIALMAAISHRQLDPTQSTWYLNVSQDFPLRQGTSWVSTAILELFDWFALFARLAHVNFVPPKIVFADGGLKFDMRLFSRPDDDAGREQDILIHTSAVQELPFALDNKLPPTIARIADLGISYLTSEDLSGALKTVPSAPDLTELCRRIFGHDSFRPGQEALILNAIAGQKSLGLMPTGGGKSLCFQLPALLRAGTTITVVPIKALGRDHCAELEAAGFTGRVVNIDSDMSAALRDKVYAGRIQRGEMRFVFVSPERLQVESFRDTIRSLRQRNQLGMFVIDEVHCMSEWGHDFRPSYLTLPGTLRELAEEVPVLGLTATASVNVLRDIQGEFQIPDELVAYEMHRSRTELNFKISKELSTPGRIETEVEKIVAEGKGNLPPPVHIFARYANGVLGVETYATMLGNSHLGLRVGSFSGAMPEKFNADAAFRRLKNSSVSKPESYEDYKKTVQTLWKTGDLDVIITTKAFGMGVNKPDVRHTLHAGMPGSMEAFYQEAGRAGRDREDAFCHMLLRPEPDNAERIFSDLHQDLTPEAITRALETTSEGKKLQRNHGGDFRAQLWFLAQGLISISEEQALVTRLHAILRQSQGEHIEIRAGQLADLPKGGARLQETLYRLYQMGLIAPWIVTDWGRGEGENSAVQAVELRKLPITFQQACRTVVDRIQAIEGLAASLPELDQIRMLMTETEDWSTLYNVLLTWVRRKHLDSRLQSTWNLYSKSVAFTSELAGAFRDELEAFFKVDSNAFQLASLRDMPQEDVIAILEVLVRGPGGAALKDKSALRKLSSQLSRLLEGTQDSPGLNLAAASLLLLTEDNPGTEASLRFQAAEPNGALAFWRANRGRDFLAVLGSANPLACNLIGEWLVAGEPDRIELMAIHDELPAHAIKAALFKELAADLAEAI